MFKVGDKVQYSKRKLLKREINYLKNIEAPMGTHGIIEQVSKNPSGLLIYYIAWGASSNAKCWMLEKVLICVNNDRIFNPIGTRNV